MKTIEDFSQFEIRKRVSLGSVKTIDIFRHCAGSGQRIEDRGWT
jgi:hypothetical protein